MREILSKNQKSKKKNLASLQWPLLSLAPASNPKDGHQSLHLGPLSTLRIFWKIWAPPCVRFCSDERRSLPLSKTQRCWCRSHSAPLHQTTAGHNPGDDTSLKEPDQEQAPAVVEAAGSFLPLSSPAANKSSAPHSSANILI